MFKLYVSCIFAALSVLMPGRASAAEDGTAMLKPQANYRYRCIWDRFLISRMANHAFSDDISVTGQEQTIGGHTYKVVSLYRSPMDSGNSGVELPDELDSGGKATCGLREEGGRIYVNKKEYTDLMAETSYFRFVGDASYIPYEETEDGELVLYDFTMKVGDRFRHVDGHEDIVVESIDKITTKDGTERKVFRLTGGLTVIEGIGCVNSPGALLFYLNPTGLVKHEYLNYYQDGQDENVFSYDIADYMDDVVGPANPSSLLDGSPDFSYQTLSGTDLSNKKYTVVFDDRFYVLYKGHLKRQPRIVNGKEYRIMLVQRHKVAGNISDAALGNPPAIPDTVLIREEGGKVFVIKDQYMQLLSESSYWHHVGDASYIPYEETADGELVLYDFTMQVGDRFRHVDGHEDVYVESIEKRTNEYGQEFRLFTLTGGIQIAEGYGCWHSPGLFLFYLNPKASPYDFGYMNHYENPGVGYEAKYLDLNIRQVAEEYVLSIIPATVSAKMESLYDLQGRRIDSPAARGVYIQNGRKVVK